MEKNKTRIPEDKITREFISEILKRYFTDFIFSDFKIIDTGYENISIIVKFNKNQFVTRIYNRYQFDKYKRTKESILWELTFIEYLYQKNIPVPKIIHTLNNEKLIETKAGQDKYFVILTEYVKGKHLKKLTDRQVKEIIYYQSLIHKYAKYLKINHQRTIIDQFGFEKYILKNYRKKIKKETEYKNLLTELKEITAYLYPRLLKSVRHHKKIPIHNDIHKGNLKFLNGKISGIFDFDDSLMGVPAIELGKVIFFNIEKFAQLEVLNKKIDELLDYYTKTNKLPKSDRPIVKMAFMLAWANHAFEFFERKSKSIKIAKNCLEYYNSLNQ